MQFDAFVRLTQGKLMWQIESWATIVCLKRLWVRHVVQL